MARGLIRLAREAYKATLPQLSNVKRENGFSVIWNKSRQVEASLEEPTYPNPKCFMSFQRNFWKTFLTFEVNLLLLRIHFGRKLRLLYFFGIGYCYRKQDVFYEKSRRERNFRTKTIELFQLVGAPELNFAHFAYIHAQFCYSFLPVMFFGSCEGGASGNIANKLSSR